MADIQNLTNWQWLRIVLLTFLYALHKSTLNIWNIKLFPTVSERKVPTYVKNTPYKHYKEENICVFKEIICVLHENCLIKDDEHVPFI